MREINCALEKQYQADKVLDDHPEILQKLIEAVRTGFDRPYSFYYITKEGAGEMWEIVVRQVEGRDD